MALGRYSELKQIMECLSRIESEQDDSKKAFKRLEGELKKMATRAEFDQLKSELKKDIAVIVQSVKDLQAQLAAGQPITDQDLADLQDDINTLTGGSPPPPPTP